MVLYELLYLELHIIKFDSWFNYHPLLLCHVILSPHCKFEPIKNIIVIIHCYSNLARKLTQHITQIHMFCDLVIELTENKIK